MITRAWARHAEGSPRSIGYPAGITRRLGALLYDSILIGLGIWGSTLLLFVIANGGEAVPPPLVQVVLPIEWIGFYAYFWHRNGQTLGMKSWRITLVDEAGALPSWRQIAIRIGVAPISLVCAGLGFVWLYVGDRQQTWHDRASGTYVVHTPKAD